MSYITESEEKVGHTPGPWAIEGRRGAGYIISAGINAQRDGPESYVGVFDPMFLGVASSDHKANALLVFSAPELLGALKAYRTAQRRMLERWSEGDEAVKTRLWKDLHACEAAADAAIAKATGAAQ